MILTLTLNKDFNAKNSRTAVVEVTRPISNGNLYVGNVTFLNPDIGDQEIKHDFGYGESLHFTSQARIIAAAAVMLDSHLNPKSEGAYSRGTIEV